MGVAWPHRLARGSAVARRHSPYEPAPFEDCSGVHLAPSSRRQSFRWRLPHLNLPLTPAAYAPSVRDVLAAGVIALLVAPAATSGSPSRFSKTQGRVLLTYVSSDGALCAMRSDGSHPVRLTPRSHVHSPASSPDGRFVAFARGTGLEQSKIAVADARGRVRWMFGDGTRNGAPLWSPDGSRIEYVSGWAHVYGLTVALRNGADRRPSGRECP